MIPAHENAECLTDIMARVEQLALASAEERNLSSPFASPGARLLGARYPRCSCPYAARIHPG